MPDVTVVGGGPAGTISARLLATSGRDVVLLEEHHCSGVPTHCAGVVSRDVLEGLGVHADIVGTISSADVVLPDGNVIHTSKRMPYAYVLDRAKLDQDLADAASDAGVDIRYGAHYKSYERTSDNITVTSNIGQFKSDLLVGADGQNSVIAASLGNNHVKKYLRGIQVDIKHRCDDEEKMILRLGSEVAPGFFAWQLPLGDITRVGLAISADCGSPNHYLERLLKNTGLDGCERLETYAGRIPLGGRRVTYSDRILLIGDSAGQIKPVSGGGLYPITRVAPLLKETVDRAYSMDLFNSTVLALYERSWKREIGKTLSRGYRLRNFYDRLDDQELCEFGAIFARPDVSELLSDIDVDDPSNVVKPILKMKGVKGHLLKTYLRTLI
ncbi:MAG: NAD(P)/FAD-dependent oxidoreductase [archaeon]|nr:NAD(P)/FAD-dependent oxidoreductase [archaeon]